MTSLAVPTPPLPFTTPPGVVARDELVRMGRSGTRAWDFLGLALRALESRGEDHELRFLVGANFARLGLGTPARMMLDGLPAALRREPGVVELERAIGGLGKDEEPAALVMLRMKGNVAALKARGVDLGGAVEVWAKAAAGCRWFAARDGNVVRWRGGAWELVGDHAGAARGLGAAHAASRGERSDPGLVVEGVDPPWALLALHGATARRADGYQPALRVVQADAAELLDGLALVDLREVIRAERTRFYVGPGAGERLAEDLRGRLETVIASKVLTLGTVRSRVNPSVGAVIEGVVEEQGREATRLRAVLSEVYGPRTPAWWRARYEAARRGEGGPLRALVLTSRYSTFIRHSSADLAEALRRAGWEATILMEPDDQARMASTAYLRSMDAVRPDLVVTINYTRAHLNGADGGEGGGWVIPANVPFVCWVQDAMAHLYDPGAGAAQGALDFLVGHVTPELHERFGYPRERTAVCPVPASEAKFAGTVRRDGCYDCEIAYVSHHSEGPAALLERLRGAMAGRGLERGLDRVAALVEEEVNTEPGARAYVPWRGLAERGLREALGSEPDARLVDVVNRQLAEPYADRLMRHQALGWAAEVAERRGWRMRLYGRGWEKHPRFGAFATGELAHGEALRDAYAGACVHLQVSAHTLVHQRVFECLLSGGFPLLRLHAAELDEIRRWLLWWATERTPEACASAWPLIRHRVAPFAATAGLMRWADAMQALGQFERVFPPVCGQRLGVMLHNAYFDEGYRPDRPAPDRYCAYWHLGRHAEHFFHSARSLEERVADLLERPGLRAGLVEANASRARGTQTYGAVVDTILGLVERGLAGA